MFAVPFFPSCRLFAQGVKKIKRTAVCKKRNRFCSPEVFKDVSVL